MYTVSVDLRYFHYGNDITVSLDLERPRSFIKSLYQGLVVQHEELTKVSYFPNENVSMKIS